MRFVGAGPSKLMIGESAGGSRSVSAPAVSSARSVSSALRPVCEPSSPPVFPSPS
jgi:hypothetical protein